MVHNYLLEGRLCTNMTHLLFHSNIAIFFPIRTHDRNLKIIFSRITNLSHTIYRCNCNSNILSEVDKSPLPSAVQLEATARPQVLTAPIFERSSSPPLIN